MAQTVGNAIKIDGLKELQKQMKLLSPEIKKDFNREMKQIAGEVVGSVRDQMPEDSGAAKRSVRPSFQNGYVQVRAGGPDVPYYPWLDFGGTLSASGRRTNSQKRAFFKEGRWIYPTIARHRPAIYAKAMAAVEKAKQRAGLK